MKIQTAVIQIIYTVRSFWDRFIDVYITMFSNFMEACKGVNNCMLTSLPYCTPYY